MQRKDFLRLTALGAAAAMMPGGLSFSQNKRKQPNIVIIYCDDLGYGDLSSFGHPTIHTPNIDRMAAEGQKWTNFYSAAPVCTPSRGALMTGRYPIRIGLAGEGNMVFFPWSKLGIPQDEVTIAEKLKELDYATACVGKWHLGHHEEYLPVNNGFDSYYGIPYSNDMDAIKHVSVEEHMTPDIETYQVPLMRDTEEIERPADQNTITKRYTEEAVGFIKENKDKPFFLYLAHSFPHIPLFAGEGHKGTSDRGLYGDVVQEIDWSTGQVISTLKELGIEEDTMVVFSSDNGPWLLFRQHGGSSGHLYEGKGTTWEGGMRVPTIFWWPGTIKPGIINDLGSTLDMMETICSITGLEAPGHKTLDSYDLSPVLLKGGDSPREAFFYYRGPELYAARVGKYKAHFKTGFEYRGENNEITGHETPLLFDLYEDPGEKYDLAEKHPEVIAEIVRIVEEHKANVVPGPNLYKNPEE